MQPIHVHLTLQINSHCSVDIFIYQRNVLNAWQLTVTYIMNQYQACSHVKKIMHHSIMLLVRIPFTALQLQKLHYVQWVQWSHTPVVQYQDLDTQVHTPKTQ